MRQVGGFVPFSYVVTPKGRIKKCKYHANLGVAVRASVHRTGSGATRMGVPYIAPEYRSAGWVFLEDLYKADSRDEVREKGFDTYVKFQVQLERKAHGAYEEKPRRQQLDGTGDSKERRLFAQKFPEELLPEEVLRRREGKSSVSGEVFEMPSLAKPDAKKNKRSNA